MVGMIEILRCAHGVCAMQNADRGAIAPSAQQRAENVEGMKMIERVLGRWYVDGERFVSFALEKLG